MLLEHGVKETQRVPAWAASQRGAAAAPPSPDATPSQTGALRTAMWTDMLTSTGRPQRMFGKLEVSEPAQANTVETGFCP